MKNYFNLYKKWQIKHHNCLKNNLENIDGSMDIGSFWRCKICGKYHELSEIDTDFPGELATSYTRIFSTMSRKQYLKRKLEKI